MITWWCYWTTFTWNVSVSEHADSSETSIFWISTGSEKRSIANALQVYFKSGDCTEKIEIEYPVGHRRRREEGIPLLEAKFQANLATRFPANRSEEIYALCKDQQKLEETPVHEFMELLVI